MSVAIVVFAMIMLTTFTKGNAVKEAGPAELISKVTAVACMPDVPLAFVEIIADPVLSEKLKELRQINEANLFRFISYIRSCNLSSYKMVKMLNSPMYVMGVEATMPKFLRGDFRKFVNIVKDVDEKSLVDGLKILRSEDFTTRQIVNLINTNLH